MSDRPGTLVNHPARVSFTVRRPSPLSSRQSSTGPETPSFKAPPPPSGLRFGDDDGEVGEEEEEQMDSSDEDDVVKDELVSGFDSMGVQRLKPSRKNKDAPLVIAPLANRDWRAVARARQAAKGYVPDNARGAAVTGPDGSQGGLGTQDTINSGPQLSGLIVRDGHAPPDVEMLNNDQEQAHQQQAEEEQAAEQEPEPLDENALALRALLRGDSSGPSSIPAVTSIPLTEEQAFQRDVADLPDEATLSDYARVPVSQFGAAMLRGMGWKPQAEGNNEPWVPAQRPALLGLGAKPKASGGVGGKKEMPKWMQRKEERRYVPVVRKDGGGGSGGGTPNGSGDGRERSRSPPGRSYDSDRGERRSGGGRERERAYDSDRERRDRDRYREKDDRDRSSSRRDREREYDSRDRDRRERDRDYDRDKRRDRDYDSRDRRR